MANKLGNSGRLNNQGELSFADIVDAVSNNFCLPAIQRGVVWSKEDIASFFDSLYKGFPVGNLLLWPLNNEEDRKITDYYPVNKNEEQTDIRGSRKIRNFLNESNKRYCIIDGQQRVTALYRGLNNKYVIDDKRYLLYFNLLYDGTEPSAFRYYSDGGFVEERHLWVPVKSIWECRDDRVKTAAFIKEFINDFSENEKCYKNVKGIKTRKDNATVRKIDSVVKYYNEHEDQAQRNFNAIISRFKSGGLPYAIVDLRIINTNVSTIEKLFEVFVRLNKSGRPLNPTDLLFAQIAKSSDVDNLWELFDNAVSSINSKNNGSGKKSRFSQDNILRFIWLAFREDNASFSKFFMTHSNQVVITQEIMDRIEKAFLLAKKVFVNGHFTFDRNTPYSMFLPIVYYFYYNGKQTKTAEVEIERYYEVSLVSDAFAQSTDTVMSKIIEVLGKNNRNNITLFGKGREFNFSRLNDSVIAGGGTFFDVSRDAVEAILDKNYVKDRDYIKQILYLLSRKNRPDNTIEYDVDHMHPKKYEKAENEGLFFDILGGRNDENEELYQYYKKRVNDFANLQLLDEYGNRGEKNDKPLSQWLKDYRKPNLHEYSINNYVCGDDVPDGEPTIEYFELKNFKKFLDTRRAVLKKALFAFFEITDK